MQGRVKDHYWDQINEAAEAAPPDPDIPDRLEMLAMDARSAIARYREERSKSAARGSNKEGHL